MRHVLAAVLLSLVAAAPALAIIEVTSCNSVVPSHRTGHLVADLDCPSGTGVTLGEGSKLKLHDHRLSGSADDSNVHCAGVRCAIIGPGEIVGGYFAVTGIADLRVIDVTARDQVRGGFDGLLSVVARRVIMSNIGFGHTNPGLTEIIRTGKLDAGSIWVHDNAGGISAVNYIVRRSTIEANGGIGIGGGGPQRRIIRSSVLGNQGGPLGVPVDVFGPTAPRMIETACNHSWDSDTGLPLDVCFND